MQKRTLFDPFFDEQGFIILDGGLATELENRGYNLDHHLWSARLLLSDPYQIRYIHLDYLKAGADCIIAASYQASIQGFIAEGVSKKKAISLLKNTVQIADAARNIFLELKEKQNSPALVPLVAASIGPYGAYLANGSEYRGNYSVSSAVLKTFHLSRWEILAQTDADLFACETIPSLHEAEILREICEQTPDINFWISFSCVDGGHINDGTPIEKAVSLWNDCKQVLAVGVNCTAPRFISSLIERIKNAKLNKPIVVYPNSGESYNPETKKWQGISDPVDFGHAAREWYGLGAQLIGGCCRTGPEHIKSIKHILRNTKS